MATQQNYVPAGSKKARQIGQAKGAKFYNALTVTQSREIEEWNARIEAKHHDRSTKHNSRAKQ